MKYLRKMKRMFPVLFLALCFFFFWKTGQVKADYVAGQVRVKVIYRHANTGEDIAAREQLLKLSYYRNQQLVGAMTEAEWLGDGEYSINVSFGTEEVAKLQTGDVIGFLPELPDGYVTDGMPAVSVLGSNGMGTIQSAVVKEEEIQWDNKKVSFEYTADMSGMQEGNLDILLTYYVRRPSEPKLLTEENRGGGIGEAEYTGRPVKPGELVVKRNHITLKEGKDYTYTCSNNVEVGTAVAQVKGIGEYAGNLEIEYHVIPKNLDGNDVAVTARDQFYDGKKIIPKIAVTVAGNKLTEGRDYTVQYLVDDSAFEKVGEILFYVNGQGNYSGGVEGKFQILSPADKPAVSPAATYTVKFSAGAGKIKGSASKKVEKNASYGRLPTAERKGYAWKGWYTKKAGGKKVTARTKVHISKNQTLYAQWTRVKAPARAKAPVLKNQTGRKMLVKLKKVSLAGGYEICYSTNANFKGVKRVYVKKGNATVKNLKKNKTYYVKVRAYKLDSAKQKVYGAYSKAVRIKIKK
jgi:uncharacterized repeat protein (TIGR02543 family)